MDRQTVYPGQILPETTLLQMTKDTMVGLAKLSAAMLGTSTIATGFSTTPTSPASLQVVVAPGEIYALTAIDGTAWSSLAADTTHSIMKQGISLDSVTLNCAAPATNGQSINYLVEAAYQELDATPVLLPYYNSSNPSQAYSGAGNNGLTQNTVRKGNVIVQIKAGASAAAGSQVTPAPDSGYVGLFVVTVNNSQTAITSSNISQYVAAPLISGGGILGAVQANTANFGVDVGSANAYAVAFSPAVLSLTDGMVLRFRAASANTGAVTFSPNGLAAKPAYTSAQSPMAGGEIVAGSICTVQYSSSLGAWLLLHATGGSSGQGRLIRALTIDAATTYYPSAQVRRIEVEIVGAGGSGGGSVAVTSGNVYVGGGGGAGGYAHTLLDVTDTMRSSGIPITIDTGGAASQTSGNSGGTTSFGTYLSALGGSGGTRTGGASTNLIISSAGIGGRVAADGTFPSGAGEDGAYGQSNPYQSSASQGGSGGRSAMGYGGVAQSVNSTGNDGSRGGGGGGVVSSSTTTAYNSGKGGNGCCVIREYY